MGTLLRVGTYRLMVGVLVVAVLLLVALDLDLTRGGDRGQSIGGRAEDPGGAGLDTIPPSSGNGSKRKEFDPGAPPADTARAHRSDGAERRAKEGGTLLAGRVVDEDRNPVEGARILCEFFFPDGEIRLPGPVAESCDDDGRFSTTIPGGALRSLTIRGPRRPFGEPRPFVPRQLGREELASRLSTGRNLEIVLERGSTLVVDVVDGEGRPVHGAGVNVRQPGRPPIERSRGTDESGRATVSGLAAGELLLTGEAHLDGETGATRRSGDPDSAATVAHRASVDLVAPLEGPVRLVLQPDPVVSGSVHGLPVGAKGEVAVFALRYGDHGTAHQPEISPPARYVGPSGYEPFGNPPITQVDLDDPRFAVHLPTGTHALVATVAVRGQRFSVATPIVRHDVTRDGNLVRLDFRDRARVRGVVVDAGGAPVPGVVVHAFESTTESWARQVVSQADGTFEFHVPSSGPHGVHARPGDGWTGSPTQRIDLLPGGSVEGIRLEVQRPARLRVLVRRVDGGPKLVRLRAEQLDGPLAGTVTPGVTRPDGLHVFRHLAPGRILVSTEVHQRLPHGTGARVVQGIADVTSADDTALTLVIDEPPAATCEGRLLLPGETGIRGFVVVLEDDLGKIASTVSDGGGRFRLPSGRAGPARLLVFERPAGRTIARADVVVRAGEASWTELAMPGGELRVTVEGDLPPTRDGAYTYVVAWPGGTGLPIAERFHPLRPTVLRFLEPGTYSVAVARVGDGGRDAPPRSPTGRWSTVETVQLGRGSRQVTLRLVGD